MQRIKVAQADGTITVYEGHEATDYVVEAGQIVVDDAHVAAVLASVPLSELAPDAPAKKEK